MKLEQVYSFDTETTGLQPYHGDRIFQYGICDCTTGETEIPRVDGGKRKDRFGLGSGRPAYWKKLREFFADTSLVKVSHNVKFDLSMLRRHKIKVPEKTVWHDTMIMAQMLRNDEVKFSLDYLAWKYAKWKVPQDDIVGDQAKLRGGYYRVDHEIMNKYLIADCQRVGILYHTFMPLIRADEKLYADYLNEIELLYSTQEMEATGILLHKANCRRMEVKLEKDRQDALNAVQKKAWNGFNPNSGLQVGKLLYGDPIKGSDDSIIGYTGGIAGDAPHQYTATGKPKTNKDVLIFLREKLPNPAYNLIFKCRSYTKGLGALRGYNELQDEKGRIHPSIKTNHASTGREACENPNLQNVEKDSGEKNMFPVPLRSCFRVDIGWCLGFVDYAGIEMRLIIGATEEPELMKVLEANGDVHHPTLQCFLGDSKGDALKIVDNARYKVLRSAYKNTGFCIAYGGSVEKVAVTLGKPIDEIFQGDRAYRERFPRISAFSSNTIRQVKRYGYVETAFGRKLYVPRDTPHAGSNYRIQGTAAGIIKRGQVNVRKWIKKQRLTQVVKPIFPIHDEIVFSFHNSLSKDRRAFKEVLREIRKILIDMPQVNVPLDVEWKITRTTWDKAKGVSI